MASARDFVRLGFASIRNPRHALRIGLTILLYRRWFATLCDRIGGWRLLAYLTVLTIDDRQARPGATQVLVLDRLYFTKDVAELTDRGALSYPKLQTHVLSMVQATWLPERLCEQISYVPRTRPEDAAAWATCNLYAEDVIRRWQRRSGVAAVLASNVDYWQHEAFRTACRSLGIPFLVLCQEVQTLPFTYRYSIKLYQDADFRFSGTAVAVFEKRTADMLVESGCCTPAQVAVTGAPRLDPWFDEHRPRPEKSCVTLLAFDGEQYFAPETYLSALAVFAEQSMSRASPGMSYVLKCKDAEDMDRARAHLAGVVHDLVLTHDWPLPDLLARSRLVMGYNSLAIIEALLSDAHLVIPQWSDSLRPSEGQNIDPADPSLRSQFEFLDSAEDWRRALEKAVTSGFRVPDRNERLALLSRWFHLPQPGSATQTVEQFILSHLAGRHESAT